MDLCNFITIGNSSLVGELQGMLLQEGIELVLEKLNRIDIRIIFRN